MVRVNLIYARARNGVIGRDGGLPWHLPEDMAHFKRQTAGCPVIMGRKTWDSLPPRFRPLPGRLNIVVTRQARWAAIGAEPVNSIDAALARCARDRAAPPEVWVIGGAELYRLALPLATRAVVTELELDADGDTIAPTLGSDWSETDRAPQVSATGLRFAFVTYLRSVHPAGASPH